jgi:hypothetical protein
MKLVLPAILVASALLSACTTSGVTRYDGVTAYAGDAIRANTVLQMVDPWPYGVDDTNLKVPANRTSAAAETAADTSAPASDGAAANP